MIVVGLGSNLGNREENLAQALRLLEQKHRVVVERISSIYETVPFGVTDQPDFLNMAAVVNTDLAPLELLDACLSVEAELGRVRVLKWGPRLIDLDVLLYNEVALQEGRLILPHPGIPERDFVLVPLREVAPDVVLQNGLTPAQMAPLDAAGAQDVTCWKKTKWDSIALCFV